MNAGLIVAIATAIAALITGIVALVKLIKEGPKIRADAMSIISSAATEQITNLRSQLGDVGKDLNACAKELRDTRKLLERAERKIDDLVDFVMDRRRWDEAHPELYTDVRPPRLPNLEGPNG